MDDERLDESREHAVAKSGLTDMVYLGDCVRELTKTLREEIEFSRSKTWTIQPPFLFEKET